MYEVLYTKRYLQSEQSLLAFLVGKDLTAFAHKLSVEIEYSIEEIRKMPYRFGRFPKGENLRRAFLGNKNYRIVYQINEDTVILLFIESVSLQEHD